MGDYEVTFPDGNVYYIDKESSYYWRIMREEEAAGSAAAILNGMGITDTEEETLDLVSTVPMPTLVDAPDAKYSPELIRSALLTYQSYYEYSSIWDSEDMILRITGFYGLRRRLCSVHWNSGWSLSCLSFPGVSII